MILTQEEVNQFALKEKTDSPSYKDYLGGFYFRDRIALLAERCCQNFSGDLIEIGVYSGQTTVYLCEIARKYGRKVIGIDFWMGDPYYKLWEAEAIFRKNMEQYTDVIEIWKVDAHIPQTVQEIMNRKFCFALSDDGHQYEMHLTELNALLPVTNGIVVADDVYYEPDVKNAMRDSVARNPGWKILFGDGLREGYIIKE